MTNSKINCLSFHSPIECDPKRYTQINSFRKNRAFLEKTEAGGKNAVSRKNFWI